MALFDKLFKKKEIKQTESITYVAGIEERKNQELVIKFEQVKDLFISSMNIYNSESCQCAYPRFQQIIGIDFSTSGNSFFKCYDTDLLIDLSKSHFAIEKSELKNECTNEKWVCKKCGSTYEYGWSDFSIYAERQKLKLANLTVDQKGKPATMPIPLFLGLIGYSYSSRMEMRTVDFGDFEKYMTEK